MKLGIFHTPPVNQGQIVEVSYTMVEGQVIRKTHDRSTQKTKYSIAQADDDDQGEYWNEEPNPDDDWRDISEAEVLHLIYES